MRTVYVVSDSHLEEIKRNQREEELENIETFRKRLEECYQAWVKILDIREHELREEIKALAPAKKSFSLTSQILMLFKLCFSKSSSKIKGAYFFFRLNAASTLPLLKWEITPMWFLFTYILRYA